MKTGGRKSRLNVNKLFQRLIAAVQEEIHQVDSNGGTEEKQNDPNNVQNVMVIYSGDKMDVEVRNKDMS